MKRKRRIKDFFKPSWVVIEVAHERYSFDTYITHCKHMTLAEVEEMFGLDHMQLVVDRRGNCIYDNCGIDEYTDTYRGETDGEQVEFRRYRIDYTIVLSKRKAKRDGYFCCGATSNKFGLYDKKIN